MVQVLTGSHDCTIRLWDLAAGKTKAVLTNHKKSVRALAMHPTESVHYMSITSVLPCTIHCVCVSLAVSLSVIYTLVLFPWPLRI